MHDETVLITTNQSKKRNLKTAIIDTLLVCLCVFFALYNIFGPANYFVATLWSILCGGHIYSAIKSWMKYSKCKKDMKNNTEGDAV